MNVPQNTSALGQITIIPDESPPQNPAGEVWAAAKFSIYEWRPGPRIADQLPPDFVLRIRCVIGDDGIRRFYPVDNREGFIGNAFTAGLALLTVTMTLTTEDRHSYRSSFLLFQRTRRSQEHLKNAMLNATSLRISRVGRDVANERSILPDTVGLDTQGRGQPWSVDRLIAEGRRAVREAGIATPTEADCVHYGLVAAARMNPLTIPVEKTPDLVRQSLYADLPDDEPISQEIITQVSERALTALHQHLDESAAAFDAWFMGGSSSFVRQIAHQKRSPGGILDQRIVRRILFQLGLDGYTYVGECLDAAMQDFRNSLAQRLTEAEQVHFEQAYLLQPHFGNLPFMLLVERFSFIKDPLWKLFSYPADPTAIGMLHRLLDWYADLARKRRQLDRTVKQRRPSSRAEGEKTPLTVSFSDPSPDSESRPSSVPKEDASWEPAVGVPSATPSLFQDIMDEICEQRNLTCKCELNNWSHTLASQTGDMFVADSTCSSCDTTLQVAVSHHTFRQVADQLP